MKYFLDTNIVSLAMGGDPLVVERMVSLDRTEVLVPQPVIAEIEYGIARLPDSRRRRRLRERLDLLLKDALPAAWTTEVSAAFGRAKADLEAAGRRIEDFDVAIAAHALADDGVLVTDNLNHLGRIRGLRLENWRHPVGH